MKTGFDLTKAKELMADKNIDCVITNSQENVYYSSWAPISTITSLKRMAAVILPLEGEPLFAVHRNEEVTARENTWIDDLRIYEGGEWESLKAIKFLSEVIKDKNLEDNILGLELLDMPGYWLDHLRELLPSTGIVDAKPIFDELRAVKSPEELKLLAKANMSTAKAITAAFEIARPGDTEKEIARNMIDLTLKYGGDTVAFVYLGAGNNIFETHHVPGDYRLRKGDLLHTDFGCFFDGYYSDISRTAVVGEPSDEQLEAYRVATGAEWAAAEAMVPGHKVSEVHIAVKGFYESQGYGYNRAFIGHGMGIGCHEFPFLGPSHGDWVLKPGMFFQVEPSIVIGNTRVHTEDSFKICDEGPAKNLSEYRDINEIQIIG
jgi:Xaa-Pro aminopeptidase